MNYYTNGYNEFNHYCWLIQETCASIQSWLWLANEPDPWMHISHSHAHSEWKVQSEGKQRDNRNLIYGILARVVKL